MKNQTKLKSEVEKHYFKVTFEIGDYLYIHKLEMGIIDKLRPCLPRRVCFKPSFEIGVKVRHI